MTLIETTSILEFITLVGLELMLNIDNILFISIIVNKVDKNNKALVRITGLSLALALRMIFVFFVEKLSHLDESILFNFSIRDFIYISGGSFLIYSAASEILEQNTTQPSKTQQRKNIN